MQIIRPGLLQSHLVSQRCNAVSNLVVILHQIGSLSFWRFTYLDCEQHMSDHLTVLRLPRGLFTTPHRILQKTTDFGDAKIALASSRRMQVQMAGHMDALCF